MPASDSRRTTASHLGRAYAGAYRGDGECAGVLGVEFGALVRLAASGGALSGNGAGGAAAAAAAHAGRGRREKARAIEWREWSGGAGRRPDQGEGVVGRGAPNAGVRPPCGRRAREREGRGRQARLLAGPKGRRVGPAAPVPFSFFLKFFSEILSNSFGLFKNHFHLFFPKAKLSQNKNPTTLF